MFARFRHASKSAIQVFDDEEEDARAGMWPGERIAPPPAATGAGAILGGLLIVLAGLAAGYAMLRGEAMPPALRSIEASVISWLERSVPGLTKSVAETVARLAPPAGPSAPGRLAALELPPATSVQGTPRAAAPERLPPVGEPPASTGVPVAPHAPARPEAPPTTASLPSASAPTQPALPSSEPPTADPSDPFQVRAAAVGLHPRLSRVLLERMTPADYRNAEFAIRTAVAETPDGTVYVWPRQRKPGEALFRVRFVAGAAAGCRRYVVTIAKDGWETTAHPMEKCGVPPPRVVRRQ
ncbi:MAG TPA: hypothetical protein VNK52_13855 [Hyphomicrobiaceae bacterium]|nr:hypothetical protein [Hyphomicrobiaceae bacterium]